jgi:PhnB protein
VSAEQSTFHPAAAEFPLFERGCRARQRGVPEPRVRTGNSSHRPLLAPARGRTMSGPSPREQELSMAANKIPEGYHSVTPYLTVNDAAGALDFYAEAFGATEKFRMPMGDKIGHAEIVIGDSHVMLSDEWPDMGRLGPKARGGATSSVLIYCDDVDAMFSRAKKAGAKAEREPQNEFWGDRMGTLVDPYGHVWMIATHVEDVSPEEMERRMAEMSKQPA